MASHHDHSHHHDDTYFMDQLFLIGFGGAFGVICLAMYFGNQVMMKRLLGEQFHPFVLGSGIVLTLIAGLRAWIVWTETGPRPSADTAEDQAAQLPDAYGAPSVPADVRCDAHSHGSHDDHEHGHSHGGGDHGHHHAHGHSHSHSHGLVDPGAAAQALAHSHAFGQRPQAGPAGHGASHGHAGQGISQGHEHDHSHTHGHADHDHGWAPWRYALLLAPIMLFLLGLPSRGPSTSAVAAVTVFSPEEAAFFAGIVAAAAEGPAALGAVVHRLFTDASVADAQFVDVKMLESLAGEPRDRERWKGRVVKIRGQVLPQSPRSFNLVRFRVSCCAADAIGIPVPILIKEALDPPLPRDSWVEVIGRLSFRDLQGKMMPVITVASARHIQPRPPDPDPYIR